MQEFSVDDLLPVQDVLRQASNHIVRSKKRLHEASGIAAREAERYREVAKKCAFTGQGSGFAYHPSFTVGEALYQYLAIPKTRLRARQKTPSVRPSLLSAAGPRQAHGIARSHKPRLRLLIPDTLVFNVEDDPQWYYTDQDGFVACMPQYEAGQAVEQFGDVRFDEDLCAVRKQSCHLPFSGVRDERDDPTAVYSNGNTLALANTKDLRVITGASTGADGGKAAEVVPEGAETFLVQKFVKSKGPHAFIIRQTLERGMPPTAWAISNQQPYGEDINHPDSLLLAGPQLLGRFVTTPLAKAKGVGNVSATGVCNITRLGPGACVETAEAVGKIKRHLETVLDRRLETVVADFTRDDKGRLWCLQIKAFRFLGCAPRRPFRLTAKARRDANCRLRGKPPVTASARISFSHSGSSSSFDNKHPTPPAAATYRRARRDMRRKENHGDDEDHGEEATTRARKISAISLRQALREGGGAREEAFGFGSDWKAAEEAAVAAAAAVGGAAGGRRKSERKTLACGMCGAMRIPEDVSFRMTTRMVRETLFHIWSRLPIQKVPRSLRLVDGETHAGDATAGAAAHLAQIAATTVHPAVHASTLNTNGPGRGGGGGGKGKAKDQYEKGGDPPLAPCREATAAAPSASVAYTSVRVCEACFTLHQAEASLARAERRLATAVGGSRGRSKEDLEDGVDRARHTNVGGGSRGSQLKCRQAWTNDTAHQPMNQQRGEGRTRVALEGGRSASTLGGEVKGLGDVLSGRVEEDRREECEDFHMRHGLDLDRAPLPDQHRRLSLCRILLAVTDILDVPKAFLEEAVEHSRSLQLRYELLGQREVISLKNPLAAVATHSKNSSACHAVRSAERNGGDGAAKGEEGRGAHHRRLGLLMPVSVNHLRVFSFLAGNTPLEGELPKGCGLDTFLTCQREILLTLSLTPSGKSNGCRKAQDGEKVKLNKGHDTGEQRNGNIAVVPNGGTSISAKVDGEQKDFSMQRSWLSSGRAGEAKLELGQFRNDHVRKIELQVPLLLTGSGGGGYLSQLLLIKAVLGLERVRSEVNISALPRPPTFHRGVYVFGGAGSAGLGLGCDPLPEAWVEISRSSGLSESSNGGADGDQCAENITRGQSRRGWEHVTSQPSKDILKRQVSIPDEQMEEDPRSVWGVCLCIVGVHQPGGLTMVREAQQRQQQQQQHQQQKQQQQPPEAVASRQQERATFTPVHTNGHGLMNNHVRTDATLKRTSTAIPAPTPTDPRGWRIVCSLFGHHFSAERPTAVPRRRPAVAQPAKAAGSDLPLGGREAHAYLQCGVSRLRQLLSGDGSASGGGVLTVQLLRDGGVGGDGGGGGGLGGGDRSTLRCHCEVPLETLVDGRLIEGTYPLLDSGSASRRNDEDSRVPNDDDGGDVDGRGAHSAYLDRSGQQQNREGQERQAQRRRQRSSKCFGGIFDPSLELGVYLYRMGPLNKCTTGGSGGSGGGFGCRNTRMHRSGGSDSNNVDTAATAAGHSVRGNGFTAANDSGRDVADVGLVGCTEGSVGGTGGGARGNRGGGRGGGGGVGGVGGGGRAGDDSGGDGSDGGSRGGGWVKADGNDPYGVSVWWRPPSLVERGKVGLQSPKVALFERPQMEPRRKADDWNGGQM